MKQVDQEFPCLLVDKNCRCDLTNSLRKSSSSMQIFETKESFNMFLQSEEINKFNWKLHYFFCGNIIVIDKKHPDRIKKFCKAGELPSIDTILSKCRERGDTWSEEVSRSIALSIDLVASNAVYYQKFKLYFFTKKDVSCQGQRQRHLGVHLTNQW